MEKVGAYTERATEGGEWRFGNPASGQQATPMLADYFNMLQRELTGLVTGAGLALNKDDDGQLLKAILAITATTGAASPVDDIDSITKTGVYIVTAATGGTRPAAGMIGTLVHYERGSSNGRHQFFLSSSGDVWRRFMFGTSPWTTWATGECTQAEAEAGTATGKWSSPLRVFQAIRSAAALATESLRGVLRVGTQAEVDAGSLDNVAVTPLKLRWGVSYLLGPSGYIALPTWLAGFTLQWGLTNVTVASNGGVSTVTLPMAFPNAHRGGFCIHVASTLINGAFVPYYSPASLSTATLVLDVVDTTHATGAKSVFYISVGN